MALDPTEGINSLLIQAARLRVAGKDWSEVAHSLDRSPDTVQHWPLNHPDEWKEAMIRAINESLATFENEALIVCRKNLRDPDKCQTAARDLLVHCRELRGTKQKLEHSGPEGGPFPLSTTELILQAQHGDFRQRHREELEAEREALPPETGAEETPSEVEGGVQEYYAATGQSGGLLADEELRPARVSRQERGDDAT